MDNKQLSVKSAVLWIFLSTILVSGSALGIISYINYKNKQRSQEAQYNIIAIVQTTPDQERLKSFYLAELLQLSIDNPTNLFAFNIQEAKKKLLLTAVIKEVYLKRQPPGTLYLDYVLRKPIAYLSDYTNTLIDDEGVIFPFRPFFTPKKLPEIYLGLDQKSIVLGKPVNHQKVKLALYLLQFINNHFCCNSNLQLTRIDVSNAFADSKGQRQTVVLMEERMEFKRDDKIHTMTIPYILRISLPNYRQEFANYAVLRTKLLEKIKNGDKVGQASIVIDLRIPELALYRL